MPRRRSAFVVVVSIVGIWWLTEPPNNLATTRYEVAKWIDANLEEDAIVGSFNSGQLGFFSNRSVVNLDGLINQRQLFRERAFETDRQARSQRTWTG